MYDLGALGKKSDSTRCGQGQFICRVTGLHLPHLDHQLEFFLWEPKAHSGTVLEHREWEAMVQTWEHDLAIPLELVGVGPIWGNTGISGDPGMDSTLNYCHILHPTRYATW